MTQQRTIVHTDQKLCVGCNHCIRVCPMETANVAYLDESGEVKVRIDESQCIACGTCVAACSHKARYYEDDLEAFLRNLVSGEPISLLVAPSIRTNIPEWGRLFTWLKNLGVRLIYDVSLGADICIWSHIRYMEEHPDTPLIAQPCPPIVSYCEKRRHELIPHLSPVHSPMACAAIYMRRYAGVTDTLAALSPCLAKADEFAATGLVRYNVTFARLLAYLAEHAVVLPEASSEFDHVEAGLGKMFPVPGGLRENIAFFLGRLDCMEKSGAATVYSYLDAYAETSAAALPRLFDVLNCADGCGIGTACEPERNPFAQHKAAHAMRASLFTPEQKARHRAAFAGYGDTLRLEDFLREYVPVPFEAGTVSEEAIQAAFAALGKDTESKRHFDCGACGSGSCRDMARKIALGLNLPINCTIKMRDDAERSNRRNAGYIDLIQRTGESLLSASYGERYESAVKNVLKAFADSVKGEAAVLWKYDDKAETCMRIFSWSRHAGMAQASVRGDWPAGWMDRLRRGEHIVSDNQIIPGTQKPLFPDFIKTVLLVPIHIREAFWGFLVTVNAHERRFLKEEVAVASAGGVLIAASVIEHELTARLIEAREDALSATRAKSEFLSRMSHEMRTPLNAIIGMAKIAARTDEVDRLRYCLSTIRGSSEHLLALINDVLDMAKIEAGKLELENAPFDLEKTLSGVCDIIMEKVNQKQQTLHILLDGGMTMRYVGDSLRLAQVVANLLSNAVKFTPDLGEIVLSASEEPLDGLRSRLSFSVSDTGIGMTPEQIARLFTAFEQASVETSRTFGGTGLGLAICKSIVEKMNGTISAASEPEGGSIFSFNVELLRHEGEDQTSRTRTKGLHVLVVESDSVACNYCLSLLTSFTMKADAAFSVTDALQSLEDARRRGVPYDIVLLAFNLPDCDADDVPRRLDQTVTGCPVIAMASYLEWSAMEASASLHGLSRFIPKPLFPSSVLDAILEVAGHEAGRQAGEESGELSRDFSGVTILLAEDIDINREIFSSLLEDTGIAIDIAENGRQAVDLFAANPDRYLMIIMDIQMPVMDGYTATETLRALTLPRAKTIPVVAMTANAFREDIERGRACGMNGHLTKPVNERALVESINFYAARQRRNEPENVFCPAGK